MVERRYETGAENMPLTLLATALLMYVDEAAHQLS
jgi:hypothetical protein